jgi:Zn-dependent protease
MLRSLKLGSAFGIGVYVHWTFILLPIYIVWMTNSAGPAAMAFHLAAVLGLFTCIVLHEFGHALMARRFGIATKDITLLPIGGVARMERMSDKPWEEICIAIAGPAVNVAIVVSLLVFFQVWGVEWNDARRVAALGGLRPEMFNYPVVEQMLIFLTIGNSLLVLFNMIPAFPMDGGRVLRATLTPILGHLRATEVAAALGLLLALGFGILGLLGEGPILILLAMFVLLAGQQELAVVRYRAAHGGAWPWEKPPEEALVLDPSAFPSEPNYSGFTWDRRARAWIEWREGRPIHACFQQ